MLDSVAHLEFGEGREARRVASTTRDGIGRE